VFAIAVAFDWISALLALFVLKPMRRRWMNLQTAPQPSMPLAPPPPAAVPGD